MTEKQRQALMLALLKKKGRIDIEYDIPTRVPVRTRMDRIGMLMQGVRTVTYDKNGKTVMEMFFKDHETAERMLGQLTAAANEYRENGPEDSRGSLDERVIALEKQVTRLSVQHNVEVETSHASP